MWWCAGRHGEADAQDRGGGEAEEPRKVCGWTLQALRARQSKVCLCFSEVAWNVAPLNAWKDAVSVVHGVVVAAWAVAAGCLLRLRGHFEIA